MILELFFVIDVTDNGPRVSVLHNMNIQWRHFHFQSGIMLIEFLVAGVCYPSSLFIIFSVGASPDSDSDSMGESESRVSSPDSDSTLVDSDLDSTSVDSDLSAMDLDSGLMDSDSDSTQVDSNSQWVRWEMYKANLNFHVH